MKERKYLNFNSLVLRVLFTLVHRHHYSFHFTRLPVVVVPLRWSERFEIKFRGEKKKGKFSPFNFARQIYFVWFIEPFARPRTFYFSSFDMSLFRNERKQQHQILTSISYKLEEEMTFLCYQFGCSLLKSFQSFDDALLPPTYFVIIISTFPAH